MSPVEGIVHRYPDRVLLKLLHVCPVYCRFCFRRESVGRGGATHLSPAALDAAFAYIAAHDEIWEVILTGGDPLAVSPRRLAEIVARACARIAHVKILRIHSRVPVADPGAGDAGADRGAAAGSRQGRLCRAPRQPRARIDGRRARRACARLIDAGIPMLSQSVLLRGVNDDVETLAALMRGFVEMRDQTLLSAPPRSRAAARRISVCRSPKGRSWYGAARADSPASASRTICSTFPAASAKRRLTAPSQRRTDAIGCAIFAV